MKVNEVLKLAAVHVGRNDLKRYIESPTDDEVLKEECENLLTYYNSVEKELALDYFPLLSEETMETETGEIFYDDFSFPPASVKGIYSSEGVRLAAEFFAEYVRTAKGRVRIVYSYMPSDKTGDDECERFYGVPVSALVAGIAKNYCLAAGMADESVMWNQTYNDCVQAARTRRETRRRITARRWI